MSLTAKQAIEFANEPAVLCCVAHEGDVLTPANFVEPSLFPDLEESGMLNTADALKIGQLLNGSKMVKKVDSLKPVTAADVDKYDEIVEE